VKRKAWPPAKPEVLGSFILEGIQDNSKFNSDFALKSEFLHIKLRYSSILTIWISECLLGSHYGPWLIRYHSIGSLTVFTVWYSGTSTTSHGPHPVENDLLLREKSKEIRIHMQINVNLHLCPYFISIVTVARSKLGRSLSIRNFLFVESNDEQINLDSYWNK